MRAAVVFEYHKAGYGGFIMYKGERKDLGNYGIKITYLRRMCNLNLRLPSMCIIIEGQNEIDGRSTSCAIEPPGTIKN
jgi:hypothetical protein